MTRHAAARVALAFLILLSVAAPFFAGGAVAAGTLLSDFESGTAEGWTLGGGSIDDSGAIHGTYALATSGASPDPAYAFTSGQKTPDELSFYVTGSQADTAPSLYLSGDNGVVVNSYTSGGDHLINTGTALNQVLIPSIDATTTYRIRYYNFDFTADTVDIQAINADTGDVVTTLPDQDFRNPQVELVNFDMGVVDGTGTAYLDDFALNGWEPPSAVSGTVEDNAGNALQGASVVAKDGETVVDSTTTDAAGAYSLSLPDGTYTIEVSKAGYVDASRSETISGGASSVDFALTPENTTINGTVEDQEGVSQSHATVTLLDNGTEVASTTSDGNGAFSFAQGAGTYDVVVTKAHYTTAQRTVTYDGVNATDAGVFVIGRVGRWEGGLYGEMKPVYSGNLTTDIQPICEFDPEGFYARGFSAFWNQTGVDRDASDVALCEPNYSGTSQLDMFHAGTSMNQSEQEVFIVMSNRLTDLRGIAYTEGKIAAVEELNKGNNQTVAQEAAREAIADVYATPQENIYTRWSAGAAQADYIADVMVEADEGDWLFVEPSTGGTGAQFDGKTTMTVTLVNNETISVTTYKSGGSVIAPVPTRSASSAGTVTDGKRVVVYSDNDKNASTTFVNTDTYADLLNQIEADEDQVKANVGTLVSNIYATYDQDEIAPSDLISPSEIASRASTDYESTGYYSFASAELAALGYGGDVNASHVITVHAPEGDAEVDGTLFYTGDENLTVGSGETVDPSNYEGIWFIASSDGIQELHSPFTVEEATDVTTGEPMGATSFESYDYATSDAESFEQLLERLLEARNTAENAQAVGGGGGGGDLGGSLSEMWHNFVSALAGMLGLDLETAAIVAAVALLGIGYVAVVRR